MPFASRVNKELLLSPFTVVGDLHPPDQSHWAGPADVPIGWFSAMVSSVVEFRSAGGSVIC